MGVLGINHIAFRTPDVERLHAFYAQLLEGEPLEGEHHGLRAGAVLLVFFPSASGGTRQDPDELAFDVDRGEFDRVLERARAMGALAREPVAHARWSRGFYLVDPDGRRIEIIHDDRSVYWIEK